MYVKSKRKKRLKRPSLITCELIVNGECVISVPMRDCFLGDAISKCLYETRDKRHRQKTFLVYETQ